MPEVTTAAVREVPIEIFDFSTSPPEGLLAGFYYNIPMPDEDKITRTEIPLSGPYETRMLALDDAREFIRDCLTDHIIGEEE